MEILKIIEIASLKHTDYAMKLSFWFLLYQLLAVVVVLLNLQLFPCKILALVSDVILQGGMQVTHYKEKRWLRVYVSVLTDIPHANTETDCPLFVDVVQYQGLSILRKKSCMERNNP